MKGERNENIKKKKLANRKENEEKKNKPLVQRK